MVLNLAALDRARRAASAHVLGFVADLRTLLKAAKQVQNRWLLADLHDSPGTTQFAPMVKEGMYDLFQRITNEPYKPSLSKEKPIEASYAGPLGERLGYAKQTLQGPLGTIVSCCSTIFDGLQEDFPDHPIDTNHRPSKANRDRRILAFWNLGISIDDIIAYEQDIGGGDPLTREALRAAVARARRKHQPRPSKEAASTSQE
jgi:hypothetical protein